MKIQENVSLSQYTTFKIGGSAKYFAEIKNKDELIEAVNFASSNKLAIFVLGGGSNLLVADSGFDGLVLKVSLLGIEEEKKENVVYLKAFAGVWWDKVVDYAVKRGLYGIENLSAIPGTVGASPVQNIGAYGVEVGNLISQVEVFDMREKVFKTLSRADCLFGYRDSIFKKSAGKDFIVVSVNYALRETGVVNKEYKDVLEYFVQKNISSPSLVQMREAVIFIREGKLPDWHKFGTAGSFFKNAVISVKEFEEIKKNYPEIPSFSAGQDLMKVPTAWILDKICNLKGLRVGNVGLYEKHSLVFVNYGGGTSKEIVELMNIIVSKVKNATGISLEPEVVFLGNC